MRAVCAVLAGGSGRSGALSAGLAISAAVPDSWDSCTWRASVGARGHLLSRAAPKRALSHLIGEQKRTHLRSFAEHCLAPELELVYHLRHVWNIRRDLLGFLALVRCFHSPF